MKNLILILAALISCSIWAGGDKAGEVQPEPKIKLPPSPPVPPADAVKTFKLAPGFRIELIASEPLIDDPVAIAFDGEGRIWAVEYIGYMPDVDGNGEDKPVGNVVVLEDTDGDWKMDKRTVFLEGLVLPRAICVVKGGILVAEVPNLFYCVDKNGDMKCDEKTIVASDYGSKGSPEHTANGLIHGLDNWIYSSNWPYRLRYETAADGTLKWTRSKVSNKGQWGISQDDNGRYYYNTNSDVLRADCVPSHYFSRNPNYKGISGINVQTVKDQSAWPVRPTPGVNRGYRSGQLREDSTLATVTAVCGPGVYRGDQFPDEFRNNVFVCEPSGNLIKRNVMSEIEGMIAGKNPYEKAEFLGSTDERFRPVNLYTGPDGTLYVVDLYRGILQHRIFVTTFLRKQILERGLDKPLGLGRIYRVVHDGKPVSGVHPKMSKDTPADLVKHLSHPNAWWRELAQKTLVERADRAALPLLKELATSGADPLGRVHALWTLEGLGKLDIGTVSTAMNDKDVRVKVAAIRVSEALLRVPPPQNAAILSKLLEYVSDKQFEVRLQLAFTLGECADPRAIAALATIMKDSGSNPLIFDAVFSSVPGRELDFATALSNESGKEVEKALAIAAGSIFAERRADRVTKLLDLVAAQKDVTRQAAMLDGMIPKGTGKGKAPTVKAVEIAPVPASLDALVKSNDKRVKTEAAEVAKLIVPPGTIKPVVKKLPPLNAAQQAVYEHGKAQYLLVCAQCHQPDGQGEEGKAPPFVDSEWVDFPDARLARIVINGLKGPVNVNGREYTMEMPGVPQMDDKTVAGVLTYIRREFGNGAPVDPEVVKKIRAELGDREDQWSEAELMKLK